MRAAVAQHAADRAQRVAFLLEVGVQADHEFLDVLRRGEGAQHAALLGGEAESADVGWRLRSAWRPQGPPLRSG